MNNQSKIPQIEFLRFLFHFGLLLGICCCTDTKPYNPEKYEHLISDEPRSDDYEVWINGTKAVVYIARVQDPPFQKERTKHNHGGPYSFTTFDMDKPVEVKIKSTVKVLDHTILRPEGAGVKNLKRSDSELSFTLEKPAQIIVEPDGKNGPLLLFANAIDDFRPDLDDPNLIYYGPGIHYPDTALIEMGDNQTLYLAEGAIVKAGVAVRGKNVTICGRGIICGNEFTWRQFSRSSILITESDNVVVKDVILRGCASWTMPIIHSRNVLVDNVKIVAGRTQTDDGINPCNSQDILIKNCFIRTDDDCIALKGISLLPDTENNVERITVENCILWCDRARIFLLGHESRAEYMRDLIFRNLDIVHFSMTAFLLEPGENMRLEHAVFEDIRINGEGQRELIRLKPVVNQYMRTRVPGHINQISFKNITVTGKDGPYKIQLMDADEEYTINRNEMDNIAAPTIVQLPGAREGYLVTNVIFDGVSVSGQKVTQDYDSLETGDFVSGVIFK